MNVNKELNYLSFKKLDKYDVINLYTTKPYNFRLEQISDEDRNKQYKKIEESLNHKFKNIISPIQKHTNNVVIVNEDNINNDFFNTDGLITNLKNVALVTKLADCQGIILLDKKLGVIDLSATIMCLENKMPMLVFGLNEENSIVNTVSGTFNGTKVTV